MPGDTPHACAITLDTCVAPVSQSNGAEMGVKIVFEYWNILSQIAAPCSLREICRRTGLEPEIGLQTVRELLRLGLIEVVAPGELPATPELHSG